VDIDLFATKPRMKVGQSNGQFLGHLANGLSTEALRAKAKAEWPDLNGAMARDNLAFKGRG